MIAQNTGSPWGYYALAEALENGTPAAKALATPDLRDRLKALTYEPVGSTPAAFDAYFKSELAKFAEVVKQAHIPPQD